MHRTLTARSAAKLGIAFVKPCKRCSHALVRTFAEKQSNRVRVIETSLGVQDNIKLLRHLGLRIGEDDEDFVEAHFGPGEDGQMSEGFLKCGQGKVADSEYLDTIDAGYTSLSKEEVLDWCKDWAKDKIFLAVGQNCWTMVYEFLDTHEGCEINDSIKRKEQGVNQASQMLVESVEKLAEEEGRKPEDVMQDLMQNPRTMFSTIFSAERLKQFMPEGMQQAVDRGQDMASEVSEGAQEMGSSEGLSVDDATSTIKDTAKGVMAAARGKAQE